jgi:hypothetical protein
MALAGGVLTTGLQAALIAGLRVCHMLEHWFQEAEQQQPRDKPAGSMCLHGEQSTGYRCTALLSIHKAERASEGLAASNMT